MRITDQIECRNTHPSRISPNFRYRPSNRVAEKMVDKERIKADPTNSILSKVVAERTTLKRSRNRRTGYTGPCIKPNIDFGRKTTRTRRRYASTAVRGDSGLVAMRVIHSGASSRRRPSRWPAYL